MKKTVVLMAALITAAGITAAEAREGKGEGERMTFAQLDTDGNGEITLAEMQARQAERFASIDTNGDGGLSAEELTAKASERADSDRVAKRVERMIERSDANGDGLIQADEMGGDRQGKMFERIDTDGNGSISEEEFEAAQKKMGDRKKPGGGKKDK